MVRLEGYMDIAQMRREGLGISEIARQAGCDRKTVRKYLEGGWTGERKAAAPRESKLDRYKDHLLKRLLVDKVWNASVLLSEIRGLGYKGGRSLVRSWVKVYRDQERQRWVYRRLETDPGKEFQVDWGHFRFGGEVIYAFAAVLSYSRCRFVRFFRAQDLEHFIEGHLEFFRRIGFVPSEGVYDNLKSVILKRIQREKKLNPRFLEFACLEGFYPRVCLPYAPTSKGKVENLIGYVRGNFWVRYAGSCADLEELNRAADLWLEEVNGQKHGTTGRVPAEALAEDRAAGTPWSEARPYVNVYRARRRVFKDATVSYRGIRYSVPFVLAGKTVEVQQALVSEAIRMFSGGDLVAEHRPPKGPGRLVIDPVHYRGMPWRARLRGGRQVTEGALLPAGPGIGSDCRAPVVMIRSLADYETVSLEVAS